MTNTPTIMIAEDSSVILTLTKKILEQQKYNIVIAKNGTEVMKKIISEPIDLILMDINIPGKNGLECTKEIRKNSDSKIANVPIVAITGNASNLTLEQFKEAGINEYLQKPLDFDQLVHTVKSYLA